MKRDKVERMKDWREEEKKGTKKKETMGKEEGMKGKKLKKRERENVT